MISRHRVGVKAAPLPILRVAEPRRAELRRQPRRLKRSGRPTAIALRRQRRCRHPENKKAPPKRSLDVAGRL